MPRPRALRVVRSWQDSPADHDPAAAVHDAMLLTVGALGFEAATTEEVAKRAGISPAHLLRRFGTRGECFATASALALDQLAEDVLGAGRRAPSWRLGLRAALGELLRFVAEQPLLARALLIECRIVGGRAETKRQQVAARFAAAIDLARRDPGSRPSASAMAADFMVGAIEESVVREIGAGRAARAERLLPELAYLVVLNYFGEDEAWLELRSESPRARIASV